MVGRLLRCYRQRAGPGGVAGGDRGVRRTGAACPAHLTGDQTLALMGSCSWCGRTASTAPSTPCPAPRPAWGHPHARCCTLHTMKKAPLPPARRRAPGARPRWRGPAARPGSPCGEGAGIRLRGPGDHRFAHATGLCGTPARAASCSTRGGRATGGRQLRSHGGPGHGGVGQHDLHRPIVPEPAGEARSAHLRPHREWVSVLIQYCLGGSSKNELASGSMHGVGAELTFLRPSSWARRFSSTRTRMAVSSCCQGPVGASWPAAAPMRLAGSQFDIVRGLEAMAARELLRRS